MKTDSLYSPFADKSYLEFSSKLSKTDIYPRMGIRIPILDRLSKTFDSPDEIDITYHEDVILRGFIIGNTEMPFIDKIPLINDSLLPYLSSWDQTDTIASRIKVKKNENDIAYAYFTSLLSSKKVYTKRLGIVWLLLNRKNYSADDLIKRIKEANDEGERYVYLSVSWALSYFYLDDPTNRYSIFSNLGDITTKETIKKIRESHRYKGELDSETDI